MPRGKKTKFKEEEVLKNKRIGQKIKSGRKAKPEKVDLVKKKNNLAVVEKKKPVLRLIKKNEPVKESVTEELINTSEEKGKIIIHKIYDQDDRQKRMIMWTGVSFFMVLIVGFWLINLRTVFKATEVKSSGVEQMNLQEITSNLTKTMSEVSESLSKLSEASSSVSATVGSSTASDLVVATSSEVIADTSVSTTTTIDILKEKLQILQKNSSTGKLPK